MKHSHSFQPVRLGINTMTCFSRCGMAHSAAALSYFLILTLFPLLMCVNYFIGLFHLDLEQTLLSLRQVLPPQVLQVIRDYLTYASQDQSHAVLAASLTAIVLSASAGLRTMMHAMDRLYGRELGHGLRHFLTSVVLSLLFLLTIYLSVVVIFTGTWFFQLLENHLPQELIALIPLDTLSHLWLGLRYLVLFSFMLLLVLSVYWIGSPKQDRGWGLIFNAALTAAALVGCSVLFSWFISMSSRYSLIYGSLASMIVLLVWLYFCGTILLFGAVAGCQARKLR